MSVVLPTYNHLHFLPRAIESVLAQTFTDFELMVVDDGSTDGTREFLAALTDPRVRAIHQENRRLPSALNAGFEAARGELLTWVSADNSCAPFFLEALVGALDAHPAAGLAYAAFAWIDDADRITGIHRDQDFSYPSLLAQNPGNAAFLYRRACQERVGLYDPELEGAEDWDMWLRIVERFPTVYVPEIVYYYRLHERSLTAEIPARIRRASERVVERALARHPAGFDLIALYPALADCADAATARVHALLDFGTRMLRSPFAPPELAVWHLEQAARAASGSPAILANLAVAYGRSGRWPDASALATALAGVEHAGARRVAEMVAAAAAAARPEMLAAAPLFVVERSGSELLQREAARRNVYSLTERLAARRTPAPPPSAAGVAAGAASTPVEPMHAAREGAAAVPDRGHAAGESQGGGAAAQLSTGAWDDLFHRAEERIATASPGASGGDGAGRGAAVAEPPLVSVLVPTFNRPDTLRAAIESIHAQTHPQVEIIVVNDAGAEVESLVASLNRKGNVTYARHGRNRGLAAARNTGLKLARGKYIAYLDDDDRFHPEHLETLVTFLEHSDYKVAYTDAWRVHQVRRGDRYETVGRDLPYSHDFDAGLLLVTNYFPVLCVMHERGCLEATGDFDESLTSHEDWDLWIRLSMRHPFAHIRRTTAEFTWRTDGSSMTSRINTDYARTKALIYRKYRAYMEQVPGLLEAQRRHLAETRRAAEPERPFECSIIVPVRDGRARAQRCLETLAAVTDAPTFEVVLVDDGSQDDTPELLAALGGDVQIVRNVRPVGFAAAGNQGARLAKGRYLVFLDQDAVPRPGWLAALVDAIEGDPSAAAASSDLGEAGGCVLVRREAFEAGGGLAGDATGDAGVARLCLKLTPDGSRR